jgi:YegS/Rv2252/BmrU family lipid kinase
MLVGVWFMPPSMLLAMPDAARVPSPPDGPVVLVTSPHSRRSARDLPAARDALRRLGVQVVEELPVDQVARLPELIGDGRAPMVVAAGGDGTVGAAANCVANTPVALGVLPLGTSNDFARSLGIPMRIDRAAALLRDGKVSTIDLGSLVAEGREPLHFVHAATAGLNVSFAKLATRASLRKRLGRFTYAFAAALALRDNRPFDCEITCEGQSERWRLTHLSVINAPVYGGFLGLRVIDSSPDDRLLDVLAVEEVPARRVIQAALHQLFHIKRPVPGVHALHVREMRVHTEEPLDVALDGEVIGALPANFVVAGNALRVVTPLDFEDVD